MSKKNYWVTMLFEITRKIFYRNVFFFLYLLSLQLLFIVLFLTDLLRMLMNNKIKNKINGRNKRIYRVNPINNLKVVNITD